MLKGGCIVPAGQKIEPAPAGLRVLKYARSKGLHDSLAGINSRRVSAVGLGSADALYHIDVDLDGGRPRQHFYGKD